MFPAVGMVPHPSNGRNGRGMMSIDLMQKARVQKFHLVAYSGHPVSAVSGSAVVESWSESAFLYQNSVHRVRSRV